MNRTPSILVNSGFPVDQNGALTEIVIPSVVSTLQRPEKVTSGCTAATWIPDADHLEFTKLSAIPESLFKSKTTFNQLTFDAITVLSENTGYVSNNGAFLNCTGLASINFPNLTTLVLTVGYQNTGTFWGCTSLTTINMPKLESITITQQGGANTNNGLFGNANMLGEVSFPTLKSISVMKTGNGGCVGLFYNCAISSFSAPELTTIVSEGLSNVLSGVFVSCTNLTSVYMPKLQSITGNNTNTTSAGCFANCTGLTTLNFPLIEQITNYQFKGCTGLTSVTLGSAGHPVTSLGANAFYGCTQSGLSMTIYTADGNALANSPFGATNTQPVFIEA